ncbi:hypothetical protein SRHO_G00317640 [Serrasalmus rhombeus]
MLPGDDGQGYTPLLRDRTSAHLLLSHIRRHGCYLALKPMLAHPAWTPSHLQTSQRALLRQADIPDPINSRSKKTLTWRFLSTSGWSGRRPGVARGQVWRYEGLVSLSGLQSPPLLI